MTLPTESAHAVFARWVLLGLNVFVCGLLLSLVLMLRDQREASQIIIANQAHNMSLLLGDDSQQLANQQRIIAGQSTLIETCQAPTPGAAHGH